MKAFAALLTSALALSACSSITGPDARDDAERAAQARRNLEAVSNTGPSMRLATN